LAALLRRSFTHFRTRGENARFTNPICLAALAALFGAAAHAQDQNCKIVPARQEFWIRLTDPVSTYSSKRGDVIRATLTAAPECNGTPVLHTGTVVEGQVTFVRKVGYGIWHDSSAITIVFNKILANSTPIEVRSRVEDVANGRETVKAGVISGIGGRNTPQQIMSTRLLHLPFWNAEDYWVFLLRRGVFPFSPEPEIYLPPGTDLRLRLMSPLELPSEILEAQQQSGTREEARLDNELREKLLSVPQRTVTHSGKASDVVNLAFVGSPQQIGMAFQAAGWTYADALSARSVLREMRAMSSLSSYAHLPISRQWLAGKAPDLRLQKSFDSYEKREHIRLWNEDSLERDLWVGSVIRETGASWSIRTGRFIHHVDPDLSAEREKVVRDLMLTGCVADVAHLQWPHVQEEEKNASGDELHSDGEVAVIELNDCAAPDLTAIAPAEPIQRRPKSKLQRFVRAQALSIHDLWRSNAIYVSFDLTRTVVRSMRRWRSLKYETHANSTLMPTPQGVN
jgi:hypothetical protein